MAKSPLSEIQSVTIDQSDYPERLKQIHNPPRTLYYLGEDIGRLNRSLCVAVIGSRNADRCGVDVAFGISAALANCSVCVVSGLALGIDVAAHNGALSTQSKFPTVAVLGNGLPDLLPKTNQHVGEQVIRNGGIVISQFPPGTPPFPQNFLDRNRVISGLAAGVVVVQAGERSGALATARYALEQGRDVFAIPGSPKDPRSAGTNQLIKEGAYLITDAKELIEHFSLKPEKMADKSDGLSEGLNPDSAGARLVALLSQEGSVHIDELYRNFPGGELEAILFELELAGLVKRLPGNFIRAG